VAVLFNQDGKVAGLQAMYDKSKLLSSGKNTYQFDSQPLIVTENRDIGGVTTDRYVITAYFEDPRTICSSKKSDDKNGFGVGNQLFFQNGTTADAFMEAPQKRDDANKQGWTNNKCLPLNGNHNFFHAEDYQKENCEKSLPVWLFFDNDGFLSGYGYTMTGMDDSPRFQHPPGFIVEYVLNQKGNTCAKAVTDNGIGYSNMNVHFVENPYLITCPITDFIPDKIKKYCNATK
jgi:hypothetical protein